MLSLFFPTFEILPGDNSEDSQTFGGPANKHIDNVRPAIVKPLASVSNRSVWIVSGHCKTGGEFQTTGSYQKRCLSAEAAQITDLYSSADGSHAYLVPITGPPSFFRPSALAAVVGAAHRHYSQAGGIVLAACPRV